MRDIPTHYKIRSIYSLSLSHTRTHTLSLSHLSLSHTHTHALSLSSLSHFHTYSFTHPLSRSLLTDLVQVAAAHSSQASKITNRATLLLAQLSRVGNVAVNARLKQAGAVRALKELLTDTHSLPRYRLCASMSEVQASFVNRDFKCKFD